ncbi:MAG: S9 family peptidase [candidate division Zixibacteria bacterium]|nr:S9 family peptidase [candidate division Zixibacteria bacterium]
MNLIVNGTVNAETIRPPAAKIIPKIDTVNGYIRTDNYFYLRNRENPEVISYLEAENKYTEAVMKHTEAFQEKLYKEMLGRIKETDLSVPEKIDDYYYYSRTEEGKQYPIYCRKKGSLEAAEEMILDVNELAAGHSFMKIGTHTQSPDHRYLAFSTDTAGSEKFTLLVKDLTTGALLSDRIPDIYYSVEWGNDDKTLFYTTLDEAMRPYKLYRHVLGDNPKNDVLVYHEKDDAFYLELEKTRSRKYIMMNLSSNTTSEVWYLDAGEPAGEFKVVHPRQHEMEYMVDHHDEKFYIVTNDNAKNFRLVEAPVSDPSKANWKDVLPHRPDVKVDDADAFKDHLVVTERKGGYKQLRVMNFVTDEFHYIEFPEPVYTVSAAGNPDFNTNVLRFNYTSLITPNSIYDYDMDTRRRELKKQTEVLGGYNPQLYQSERISAEAPDGTEIPISLIYKKGMQINGQNFCYLYGYGSYGFSMDPNFNSNRLSLLDRGFVFAIPHIRGGGEMGRYWYEDGKLLKKKNTFTDFIACAEHLVGEKYTSKDRLVVSGGSAGGLLMGAVTNMRPDLFRAVVAKVPFVDVVNTMLDATIPLTVIEYEEWGNPNKKEFYDYMMSYSPYDNVAAKKYPNMLITAGLNDPRVAYWEPAKWTAKLRALKKGNNRLLLKMNMGAGHGGASGRYDYLKEIAFEYAFVLDVLGMND